MWKGNVIVCSDIHLVEKAPASRKEKEAGPIILGKIESLLEEALSLSSYGVLCTGDFFHRSKPPLELINSVDCLLSQYEVKFYTAIGNHDVPAGNIEHISNTGLGVLERYGSIIIPLEPVELGNFRFYFFHWNSLDCKDFLDGKFSPIVDSKLNVAIVHARVGEASSEFSRSIYGLKFPGFSFAVFGDIHDGFGPVDCDGCIAINPGSLFRNSIKDKNRVPKAVILYEDGTYKLFEVPCEIDAFYQKNTDKLGLGFLASLDSHDTVISNLKSEDLVSSLGKKLKFSKKSIELLLEYME